MTQFLNFDATSEDIQQGSVDVKTGADQNMETLTNLLRYCQSLDGPWLGKAQTQFQLLMRDFGIHHDHLNHALMGISSGLGTNANNDDDTENTNTTNITTVSGSMPPINLP
jgi:uncharacterized protein YukE